MDHVLKFARFTYYLPTRNRCSGQWKLWKGVAGWTSPIRSSPSLTFYIRLWYIKHTHHIICEHLNIVFIKY